MCVLESLFRQGLVEGHITITDKSMHPDDKKYLCVYVCVQAYS